MRELDLKAAVSEIVQTSGTDAATPFPFAIIVGAGISQPTIPTASSIEEECRLLAKGFGRTKESTSTDRMSKYAHWFERAFPNAENRKDYLRNLMQGKPISPSVFRLAHILGSAKFGNLVITPNFDDFLTRALALFGSEFIVCDHPSTIGRLSIESKDLQILHVHGTYWFYDCCNLVEEIAARHLEGNNQSFTVRFFLDSVLFNRSAIVVGYSGWEGDVIMSALKQRLLGKLKFNLYWFCYRRADLESLPDWLTNSEDVRFVVPATTVISKSSQIGDSSKKESETSQLGEPTKKEPESSIDLEPEPRLSAETVFDEFVKAFELDPLKLRKTLFNFLRINCVNPQCQKLLNLRTLTSMT